MYLVITIDVVVIGGLVLIALSKGLERALPFFAFMMVLVPNESKILVPGLFDLTTQRLAVVTLAVLFLFFGGSKPPGPQLPKQKVPLRYLIWMHFGWAVVSTMESVNPMMSFKELVSQVVGYYLLYYIFYSVISNEETIKRIMFGMVSGMFVCCIFGFIESYFLWSVLDLFPAPPALGFDTLGRGLRVRSTFPHPILFGAAITMVVPVTLYLLTQAKRTGRRVFLWITVMLLFLNSFKCVSRGPWLSLLVSLLLLLLLLQNKARKYVLVIVVLAVAVLIIRPGVRQMIEDIVFSTFEPDSPLNDSYEYRYVLSHVVHQALSRDVGRGLWGYGMETFATLGLTGPFKGKSDYPFISCDGDWPKFMIETGYVGALIMGLLLLKVAWIPLKSFLSTPKPDRDLSGVFFVILVSLYLMMSSAALYSWGQNGYLLWMVIASSVAYSDLMTSRHAGRHGNRFRTATVGADEAISVATSRWDSKAV